MLLLLVVVVVVDLVTPVVSAALLLLVERLHSSPQVEVFGLLTGYFLLPLHIEVPQILERLSHRLVPPLFDRTIIPHSDENVHYERRQFLALLICSLRILLMSLSSRLSSFSVKSSYPGSALTYSSILSPTHSMRSGAARL